MQSTQTISFEDLLNSPDTEQYIRDRLAPFDADASPNIHQTCTLCAKRQSRPWFFGVSATSICCNRSPLRSYMSKLPQAHRSRSRMIIFSVWMNWAEYEKEKAHALAA